MVAMRLRMGLAQMRLRPRANVTRQLRFGPELPLCIDQICVLMAKY